MGKITTNLLGIVITILAGTWFYSMLCNECISGTETKTDPVITSLPAATAYPFEIKDDSFGYSTPENFDFRASTAVLLTPIAPKVIEGIGKLKAFLDSNPAKTLRITGLYKSDEANPTAFPNLGLARANSVKNYLVDQGIAASRMDTFGHLSDEMVPDGDIYRGPAFFNLKEALVDGSGELNALFARINASPLVLHFNTAAASIDLTSEQRQKFADISRYLDKDPSATCLITGHTDNTGDASKNVELGQHRADFAKEYLISNGIPASRISAVSKGQTEPVASNATEEGQAQNRRTVVTITKTTN